MAHYTAQAEYSTGARLKLGIFAPHLELAEAIAEEATQGLDTRLGKRLNIVVTQDKEN